MWIKTLFKLYSTCYICVMFFSSKIHRIDQAPQPNGPPQEAIHPMTNSHLVELTVLAPSGSDVVAEDMKNFAEQLKPLVLMDKVTGRPV